LNFWMMSYTILSVPKDLAAQEMPTLQAIEASYKFKAPNISSRYPGYQFDYHPRRNDAEKSFQADAEKQDKAPGNGQQIGASTNPDSKLGGQNKVGATPSPNTPKDADH
jgi:hypothetical protein